MTSISGSKIGKYYTRLTIGRFSRPGPFDSPDFEDKKIILLPLPSELRDDTGVNYTGDDLNGIGDLINGDLSASAAGAAGLRNAETIIDATSSFVTGVLSNAPFMGRFAGALAPDAASASSALQQTLGVAPNPNPSVAFKGPDLRTFSLTWAFYPKSVAESERVHQVIKILKSRALPRNLESKSAALLKYPDMVQVNFFPWDSGGNDSPWNWTERSIVRYKKCVMTNIIVNYNPFGTPAFFEGTNMPSSYQLTINFREIEYMLSHDWEEVQDKANYVGNSENGNIVQEIQRRVTTGIGDLFEALTQ